MLNQPMMKTETCEWCGLDQIACEDRREGTICPEYNDPDFLVTPEIEAMIAETAKRAALWEAVEQHLTIKYTADEIVVSGRGTFQARHALKARGFKYDGNKAWRFRLRDYYAFRVSCGRLQDCKIRHIPEPANWIVDVARALGIEA